MTTLQELGVDWFPQQYAHVFYVAKGILALASTLLLLIHMNQAWGGMPSLGQRMRYLTLLGFSVLVTGASAEQVWEDVLVSYRHLGATVLTILLIITMVVSIREDRRRATR